MNNKQPDKPQQIEKTDLLKAKIDLGIMRYEVEAAKAAPPKSKSDKIRL